MRMPNACLHVLVSECAWRTRADRSHHRRKCTGISTYFSRTQNSAKLLSMLLSFSGSLQLFPSLSLADADSSVCFSEH